MQLDLVLRGGCLALPDSSSPHGVSLKNQDIGLLNGKIHDIGDLSQTPTKAAVDASGLHILPGVIDSQVHFREPGLEHKEDLETGTLAALKGGVTCIFEMPNTNPSTTTREAFADKLNRAENRAHCHYGFFIGASAENAVELAELEKQPGCVGVKIFMGSSTGNLLVENDDDLERILSHGQRRVAVHCEDEMRLRERKDLARTVYDHPVWRDEETALRATKRLLRLSEKTGRPVHVLHITTRQELDELAQAKSRGVKCTVECTPQHLTLFAPDCYERLGAKAQQNPPIRGDEHRQALWKAMANGTIDVIGTDHAPHTLDEKMAEYPGSPSGMPGVQTFVPLMLDHVNNGRLSLEQLVAMICHRPASLYGLKNKGRLQTGFDADLTVVDLSRTQTVEKKWLASRCGWSPFEELEFKGWPVGVILSGQKAMWEGEVLQPSQGQRCEFES